CPRLLIVDTISHFLSEEKMGWSDAYRDKLSGLNDQLMQQQATLNTDYQLLLKQYETISTSYSAEQEKTGELIIKIEKMQAALDKDLD
ncbi:hypothetical protein, partial [uncultured Psychrobacter sp.]|uniref:hypothetical protein n=1 Tax=uncultured Psychrobacter sp. TaxID=259303 RepID=UPI00259761DB